MTVFVVSAPSGAGKTTLNRRLIKECPQLEMSVSHTTRAPRSGEQEGVHYYFVQRPLFEQLIQAQAFLEWAEVHGNLYGTSFKELERIENQGKSPILEIDVQGWQSIRARLPQAISIFILPPSLRSLWDRLESRGSDLLEQRWKRFQNAYAEIKNAKDYNVLIVNEDLEQAFQKLKGIMLAGKGTLGTNEEALKLSQKLNEEFETAEWIKGLRSQLGS